MSRPFCETWVIDAAERPAPRATSEGPYQNTDLFAGYFLKTIEGVAGKPACQTLATSRPTVALGLLPA